MSGPDVYISWPTLFQPIPDNLPAVIPPPVKERSFRSPFGIDKALYNIVLRPEIPIIFATVYIVGVFWLNAYNKRRDHEPWSISKQPAFKYFVVAHNVLLALYSFATFLAMFRAIVHTLPDWSVDNWKVKTADALCKLHGPRGLGDAATFNSTINIWEVKNTIIRMGYDGNPDPTDVGRLWNEGLAFWGWMFYVSKFYEVLDTGIILAKGKRSATLQTYHHAGAMLCMWAGIRYMSPPIWMFVFINSGIHALMYTYFTLSALNIKVPPALKRVLTLMQIGQFIFGASYAAAHLFVQYDIPISTPYQLVHSIERVASRASSVATSATSAVSEFVELPTLPATMGSLVKKLLLRAAGEEGVAERVRMPQFLDQVAPALANIEEKAERFIEKRFETKWRTEWTRVNCIDTSGEAFAIYLNLLYLAPLTYLFWRFFVRAYMQRSKARTASQAARDAAESAKQARKEMSDAIEHAGEKAEDHLSEEAKNLQEQLKKDVKAVREGNFKVSEKISEKVQNYETKMKELAEKAKEGVNGTGSPRRSSPSKKADGKPKASGKLPNESAIEDESEKGAQPAADASGEDKKSEPPSSSEQKPAAEPEEKQKEDMEGSRDDTDAMGRSGAIIDHTPEKDTEAESNNLEGSS